MLDLKSLKLFVACVETGSLSRVAKDHHIALAALSRRITLLEDNFGTPLLKRGRGVKPTDAGQTLYHRAHKIFEQVNLTYAELQDYIDGKKGRVSIIVSSSIINYELPKQLNEFNKNHPDIRLEIDEAFTSEVIDSVRNQRHDLGIILKTDFIEDLVVIPYDADELVIVTHRNTVFTEASLNFEQIINMDFILMEGSTTISKIVMNAASKLGKVIRIRVRVSSFETICRMVEAGFGLSVIPKKVALDCAKIMQINCYALNEEWSKRQFFICYLKDKTLTLAEQKLLACLEEYKGVNMGV